MNAVVNFNFDLLASHPHWERQRMLAWDPNAFREAEPFCVEKYFSPQQSINVFEVKGTSHPDYQGLTWRQFLETGKRMALNLRLFRENPRYYLEDAIKLPPMYYVALDDSGWYVDGDGNHRTCIARFFFHELGRTMLHGVHVTSYKTDPRAREVFDALSSFVVEHRMPYRVVPHRTVLSRDDTGGWMRETYRVSIKLIGRDETKSLSAEEAWKLLETWRKRTGGIRGIFRRFLG